MIRAGATQYAKKSVFKRIQRTSPEQSQATRLAHAGVSCHGAQYVLGQPQRLAQDCKPESLRFSELGELAQHWSSEQRLQALLESHALTGPELNAWCREKGLFEHQLKQWRQAFCSVSEPDPRQCRTELRALKTKNEQLQRDLHRKDKALAETAALLVLQKKFQALLEDADK